MVYVCILRSERSPEQLYIGASEEVNKRVRDHNSGKCVHTSKFKPWKIVYVEEVLDTGLAFKRERQIKKWSRGKKEALIRGQYNALIKLSKKNFKK